MSAPLNASLLKGFEILRLVTRDRPDLTASRIETELGMNFATAHRFLTTLEEAGALVGVRRGVYRLSLATAELGRMAEQTNPVVPLVQPLIEDLSARLSESVMVCRLGRTGPTCVAVALADRPITVSIKVGTTLSLVNSAQGRIWLAHVAPADLAAALAGADPALDRPALDRSLAEIRASGVARNLGLAEPDVAAVAAPVRGARGEVMMTLSVFGPLGRFTQSFLEAAEGQVTAAARRIEAQLRGQTRSQTLGA